MEAKSCKEEGKDVLKLVVLYLFAKKVSKVNVLLLRGKRKKVIISNRNNVKYDMFVDCTQHSNCAPELHTIEAPHLT